MKHNIKFKVNGDEYSLAVDPWQTLNEVLRDDLYLTGTKLPKVTTEHKAFAEAADKDKFKDAAAMFRATARAEENHVKSIGDMITAQGGKPVAGTAKPEVKTTAENVKAAIAGESAESGTVYPGFAETAKAEENGAAERLFKLLAEVDGQHAKLYKKADKDLAYWKKAEREFWLCPVCGNVTTSKKESCAVCATDPGAFEQVK